MASNSLHSPGQLQSQSLSSLLPECWDHRGGHHVQYWLLLRISLHCVTILSAKQIITSAQKRHKTDSLILTPAKVKAAITVPNDNVNSGCYNASFFPSFSIHSLPLLFLSHWAPALLHLCTLQAHKANSCSRHFALVSASVFPLGMVNTLPASNFC